LSSMTTNTEYRRCASQPMYCFSMLRLLLLVLAMEHRRTFYRRGTTALSSNQIGIGT
jgi:hypothetical protein